MIGPPAVDIFRISLGHIHGEGSGLWESSTASADIDAVVTDAILYEEYGVDASIVLRIVRNLSVFS